MQQNQNGGDMQDLFIVYNFLRLSIFCKKKCWHVQQDYEMNGPDLESFYVFPQANAFPKLHYRLAKLPF